MLAAGSAHQIQDAPHPTFGSGVKTNETTRIHQMHVKGFLT